MIMKNSEIIKSVYEANQEDLKSGKFMTSDKRNKMQDFNQMVSSDDGIRDLQDIQGVLLTEPHSQDLFFTVLYDRVMRDGVLDILDTLGRFDTFKSSDQSFGASWSKIIYDVGDVDAFDETASPIPKEDALRFIEVFADDIVRKKVGFSFSEEQIKTAFLNESGISSLLAGAIKKVRDTIDLHLENYIATTVLNGVASDGDIKVYEIDNAKYDLPIGIDTTEVDPSVIFSTDAETTAKQLRYILSSIAKEMASPSEKYNIGDSDGAFMTNTRKGELILIVDPTLLGGTMLVDDELFGKSTDFSKNFKTIIELPSINFGKTIADDDEAILGYILDPNAIEWKIKFDELRQFRNDNGLYTNYWHHIWYQSLFNPCVNALQIKVATQT